MQPIRLRVFVTINTDNASSPKAKSQRTLRLIGDPGQAGVAGRAAAGNQPAIPEVPSVPSANAGIFDEGIGAIQLDIQNATREFVGDFPSRKEFMLILVPVEDEAAALPA